MLPKYLIFILTFLISNLLWSQGTTEFCNHTKIDLECADETTGSITMSPAGGTEPYNYDWSHNSILNEPMVSNLDAGMYSVTVTDATGAFAVCMIEITSPSAIMITDVVEVDPMCGQMDGSLTINAVPQSGSDPADLMYSITGGMSFQPSNQFSNLGPDDYLIIVADSDGCFIVESRQLVDAPAVEVMLASAACLPTGGISLDITATGGTLPYDYAWTGPGGFTATTEDINGGPQGSYTLVITDREGCATTANYTQDNCCDPTMFCESTVTNSACAGDDTGVITITPVGGVGPFDYDWSHNSVINESTVTDLSPGIYMVTVSDASGCSAICGIEITEPGPIVISDILERDPMCGLQDGRFEILASPSSTGCQTLEYSIDGGMTFQASNIFEDLAPGDFLVIVKDCDDCFVVETTQLVDAPGVSVMFGSSCNTSGNVDIDLVPMGGTTPYTFTWDGPNGFSPTTEDIVDGPQGSYNVTVTDREGCSATASFVQDMCCNPINFCDANVQDIRCNGDDTGFIQLNPSGGAAPYGYTWSHTILNDALVTDLSPGTYTVTVTDASGCSAACSYDIVEPTSIVINDILERDPMCGLQDGRFEILATPKAGSGCHDLEYSIDGGMTFQSSNIFENLSAGDYLVLVKDCDDCFVVESPQLVDAPGVAVSATGACNGGNVNIDLVATGGTTPYSYNWVGPGGFMSTLEDIVDGPQGTYNVTVTDREGCEDTAVVVQEMCCDPSGFCNANVTHPVCNGEMTGFITMNPQGGAAPFNYQWSHNAIINAPQVTDLGAGTYTVTVTDSNDCSAVCSFTLDEPTSIVIDDIVERDPMCGLQDGRLEILATPKTGSGCHDLVYSIDGGMTFSDSNVFEDLSAGDYLVVVRDCDDCFIVESPQLVDGPNLDVSVISGCNESGLVDIDITVMGGTPDYDFTWTGPNGFAAITEDIVDGPEGVYNVSVVDREGCSQSLVIDQQDCCNLSVDCPSDLPAVVDISSVPEIPSDLLDDVAGNDIAAFESLGGSIGTSPGPCGDVIITATDMISGTGCTESPYLVSRTFTISDNNQQLVCVQMIPVQPEDCCGLGVLCPDDPAIFPSLDAIPEINAEFLDGISGNDESIFEGMGGSITDACGDIVITVSETVSGNGCIESPYVVVRNFVITDGVTSFDCSQTLNVTPVSCVENAGLGNYIWEDLDGDGMQDTNEPGVPNIMVSLYTSTGVLVNFTFTDSSGFYFFDDLNPGNYIIEVDPPSEWSVTLPNVGPETTDSDIDGTNGPNTTAPFFVGGEDEVRVDIGLYRCIPVGDLVWFDTNGNNQWDDFENGINGILVEIYKLGLNGDYFVYDSEFTSHKPGTPSDDGYFKFCVPPGSYYLKFHMPPFGLVPVTPGVGSSENDSDVTNSFGSGTTNLFTVSSGGEVCDLGAGYYPMAILGDLAWFDANRNGMREASESGLPGVVVELYDSNTDNMIASQVTDLNGNYMFDYLQTNSYYLRFNPPSNFAMTAAHTTVEESDSDVDDTNGLNTTDDYQLSSGMEILYADAGFIQNSVVAVNWLGFQGWHRGSYNELEWRVIEDENVSHYEVERRTDSNPTFETIGREEIKLSNQEIKTYSFDDNKMTDESLHYYRIKQYDLDGSFSYSELLAINSVRVPKFNIAVMPNPVRTDLNIEIELEDYSDVVVSFYSVDGQKVVLQGFRNGALDIGMNVLNYDLTALPAGVYSIQFEINGVVTNKKILKI